MVELVDVLVVEDAVVVMGVIGEAALSGGPRTELLEVAFPTLLIADKAELLA